MHEETRVAQFDPKFCTYWILAASAVMALTLVGIPLLVLFVPLGRFFTRRYLAGMECRLTHKALKVKKGVFVCVEKTIPLEKTTDMGMVQGPPMRHFGLQTLTVEIRDALLRLESAVKKDSGKACVARFYPRFSVRSFPAGASHLAAAPRPGSILPNGCSLCVTPARLHLMAIPGFATIRSARTPALPAPPTPEDNATWKTP